MMTLYASVIFTIVLSFFGGHPAMVSAAAGSMALSLVKDHGIQYLLAATILCGVFQIILGMLKIGNLLWFIPKTVMTGFVNALAILIFSAKLKLLTGEVWQIYLPIAIGMAIIYFFRYITKKVI
jgi:SulP family sulfate permease